MDQVNEREQLEILTIEQLVCLDPLVSKVDAAFYLSVGRELTLGS
ncbi:hypothetical protein [Sporosarcina gallistercoris]